MYVCDKSESSGSITDRDSGKTQDVELEVSELRVVG